MNPSDIPSQPSVADDNNQIAGLPAVADEGALTSAAGLQMPSAPTNSTMPPLVDGIAQPELGVPLSVTVANAVDKAKVNPVAQTGKLSQYSPGIAEDIDLIEKEWVLKAKAIVNNTQGNPSAQSSEISRFKADYLKTRYSKDMKVND